MQGDPSVHVEGMLSSGCSSSFGSERPAVSDWASALSWGGGEAELVHELQAGSETAFDWLVTHYHAPVYNLILGMLGDTSDAADGTQEVFLKAFRGIRNFRQGSSLKTWLYRIAIREALNHKRWFKRHLQKNVSIDAEPEEGQGRIEIEDLCATPFEQLAALEIQVAVHEALQHIPDVFRSAVILRDLEGLSYEEVAEVLECTVGTVKSRILRGRQKRWPRRGHRNQSPRGQVPRARVCHEVQHGTNETGWLSRRCHHRRSARPRARPGSAAPRRLRRLPRGIGTLPQARRHAFASAQKHSAC